MNRAELIDALKRLKPGECYTVKAQDHVNSAAVADVLKILRRSWLVADDGADLKITRSKDCKG